ncbi:MAG: TetR/AcrR family transcriptional regulator [Clostridia bacterium]
MQKDKKTDKRELILNSAIEIFLEKGFENTTVTEIARHSGIGKGTVYEYFKSKDELILSCVSVMLDYFNKGFIEIMSKELSFREKLCEYFKHADVLTAQASGCISLMMKNSSQAMFFMHDMIDKQRIYIKSQLEVIIQKAIEKNEIRGDISLEALSSYIQMSILQILHANTNDEKNENLIDEVLTIIFEGVGV